MGTPWHLSGHVVPTSNISYVSISDASPFLGSSVFRPALHYAI